MIKYSMHLPKKWTEKCHSFNKNIEINLKRMFK